MKVINCASTNKYKNIMKKARRLQNKRESRNHYYEKHHIIPRSLGGSDDCTNLVLLTAREHILCHYLLTRMTKGESKRKMIYAYWNMTNGRIGSNQQRKEYHKHYARAKQLVSVVRTKEQLGKNYDEKYGKKKSAVIRAKMSASHKGRIHSPEAIELMRLAKLGRKASKETRAKMVVGQLNRKKIHCRKCNRDFDPGNYNRYHGAKCKGITIYKCQQCKKIFNPPKGTAKKFCSSKCSARYFRGGYAIGTGRYQN